MYHNNIRASKLKKGSKMSEDITTTTEQETAGALFEEQHQEPETMAIQDEVASEATESDTETTTTDESEKDELLEWAEKKGLKTDDPKALLKMVRESEKKMHEATKEANALKNSVYSVSEDNGLDEVNSTLNRLAVTEFYLNNPEARKYDEQMAEIVLSKPYLAGDLEVLYKLAKADSMATENVVERQAGRKEALAQVAKAESAMPPQAQASTRQGYKGVTDDDIAKMSLEEYEAFKKDTGYNPFAI